MACLAKASQIWKVQQELESDYFSPHLCVGFLFLVLHPVRRLLRILPSPPSVTHNLCSHTTCPHTTSHHTTSHHTTCHHTTCLHTTCPQTIAHTPLDITPLAHTQLAHTQLVHTPLLITPLVITPLVFTLLVHRQLVITQLDITPLAHTQLAHTQLVHTPLLITPLLITPLVITPLVFTLLVHRQLVITQLVIRPLLITPLVITPLVLTLLVFTLLVHRAPAHRQSQAASVSAVCAAASSVAVVPCQVLQAWHLATWIVTLRGRRGTYGTVLALVARLVPRPRWDAAAFCVAGVASLCVAGVASLCVAGVALDDMDRHFAWQAWHLSTHGSSLCVAGVALMALGWLWWRAWFPGRAGTPRRFAWQAWHFVTSTFTLCGRRGTSWHGSSLCVAGVALAGVALVNTWIVTLRGRRGTCQHMDRHFAHWVGSGGALGSQAALGRRGVCVAGVALCDIHLHFVWQAWHFMTWIVTLRGRRGTCRRGTCQHMDRHFAWQAWHACAVYTVYSQKELALACMDRRAVRRSSAWTRPCERQKKRSRSWPIRTVSVQSVAAILVLLAFSGSYITALAAVAWQVHHAAMSWSLLVLLQLTVLICLLSICASETNSLRDSRCFLLFCQAPTSSRRCCCSIHAYIHTYTHTCMHACTTYSYRSIRGCYCERAGAVWGDLMLLD